jgi:hypothetical protein
LAAAGRAMARYTVEAAASGFRTSKANEFARAVNQAPTSNYLDRRAKPEQASGYQEPILPAARTLASQYQFNEAQVLSVNLSSERTELVTRVAFGFCR